MTPTAGILSRRAKPENGEKCVGAAATDWPQPLYAQDKPPAGLAAGGRASLALTSAGASAERTVAPASIRSSHYRIARRVARRLHGIAPAAAMAPAAAGSGTTVSDTSSK